MVKISKFSKFTSGCYTFQEVLVSLNKIIGVSNTVPQRLVKLQDGVYKEVTKQV